MQMLTSVEVPIHPAHPPVKHVTRAVASGVTVRHRVLPALAAQVEKVLQDNPVEVPTGPFPEPTQPLTEVPAIGRVICLPDLPRDLPKLVLQVFGPVADLEPPVQEAQEDDHPLEQRPPARL